MHGYVARILLRTTFKNGVLKGLRLVSSHTHQWIQPTGYKTGIHVYNSLSKQKNELVLPKGKYLSWYGCGPTVYDSSHIGHASNYVRYDIIRRILQDFFGLNVCYMMGVTDIDDKIIKRSNELDKEFTAITSFYEREFFQEMSALNILQPSLISRVTDYIPEIVAFISRIIQRGHAYKGTDGSVYFDVARFGVYYKFIPQQEHAQADAKGKKSVEDFALWKVVKPGEPYWESPWGPGRPGWHIECSAMASRVFGSTIDIHSGGIDLMFPHHENELAQSCSYHGVPQWANYWFHTGFLYQSFDSEKMSKSLKNTISVAELLKTYTANQFRMFCMLTHYRNNIEFNSEKMAKAVSLDSKIGSFLQQCDAYVKGQIVGGNISEAETMAMLAENEESFLGHLRDDFHTPLAMEVLFDLISTVNTNLRKADADCRSPGVIAAVQLYVKTMCQKLGFQKKGLKVHDNMSQDSDSMKLREVLDNTVKFRHNVRQFALNQQLPRIDFDNQREYKKCRQNLFLPLLQECDNLRSQLSNCQIRIQDHSGFSSWEFDDTKNNAERAESDPDITGEKSNVLNSSSQGTSAKEVASKSQNDQGQQKSKLTSTDKHSSDSDRTSA
ncbi:hypothetical protein DPMN_113005 [Dreissena polymorpha]|uniref:cysteine--tRNA ligase n=2 Tax=Dreissena polymorpha TaxID=45954 RepID=A0A9D4KGR8_DREPO|nr:hypothetical protein DPMN_113005 [Dreissena polymorpha]